MRFFMPSSFIIYGVRNSRKVSFGRKLRVGPVLENQMFPVGLEICFPDSFSATAIVLQRVCISGRVLLKETKDCLAIA